MLIWSRRHLEDVLDEYVQHYNDERRTEALIFGRHTRSRKDPRRAWP
jgi:hypothetical protein